MRGRLKITGKTRVFGIFGWPVHHSLSPVMQNAAFQYLNLDSCYLPFAIRPEHLPRAVQAIVPLGIGGVNVTVPHKEAILPLLHEITPEAERMGAINTIQVLGERLIGHNTDGIGFRKDLEEKGIRLAGKKAVLLGAGGSAKAVALNLASAGLSSLTLINRSPDRALALQRLLQAQAPLLETRCRALHEDEVTRELLEAEILVNTTSMGLDPSDPLLIPRAALRPSLCVYDLIYNPAETPLLSAARQAGARTVNGSGMLLHQGALSFEIWTGKEAPVDVMRSALKKAMDQHGG